ncbi:MAG: AbrB/MazE/SpoVT family DNA-binding domain-containing protein [Bacillota bacterium]|nr:AbrB/MazE/SpoVT family DNA-binding domain-containing protein [Bacillota bacterium]
MKVKISSKGQISIPVDFRRRMHVEPGDEISIIDSGDSLIIYPSKKYDPEELKNIFEELRGSWHDLEVDGAEYVRDIRKGGTRDVW